MPNLTIGEPIDDMQVSAAVMRSRLSFTGAILPSMAFGEGRPDGVDAPARNGGRPGQGGYFAEHH